MRAAPFFVLLIAICAVGVLQLQQRDRIRVRPGPPEYSWRFDDLERQVGKLNDQVGQLIKSTGSTADIGKSVEALDKNISEFRGRFLEHRRATEGRRW